MRETVFKKGLLGAPKEIHFPLAWRLPKETVDFMCPWLISTTEMIFYLIILILNFEVKLFISQHMYTLHDISVKI